MAENKGKIDVAVAQSFLADHYDTFATRKPSPASARCAATSICPRADRKPWQPEYGPAGTVQNKAADARACSPRCHFTAAMGHSCGIDFKAARALEEAIRNSPGKKACCAISIRTPGPRSAARVYDPRRGACTPACRVETHLDTFGLFWRSHECERGMHECMRHSGVFVVLAVLALAAPSNAQVAAAISGKVLDPSGAVVAGAKVTVTSLDTGTSRTVTSNDSGDYTVLGLPLGPQEVTAESPGLHMTPTRAILVVGQEAVVNLMLTVGGDSIQLTVSDETPVVNTTTSSVSGVVGEREVKDLPLNGRSFDNLITLNPGAINYSA